MQCCGSERTTRFCPECGRKLRADDSLESLLAHCRSIAIGKRQAAKTEAKNAERFRESFYSRDTEETNWQAVQCEKRAARNDEIASKWESWAEQLAALLDEMRNVERTEGTE